jgi:CRISPR-associated protein Cmr5
MQTMQQRRAADALKRVEEVKGKPFDDRFKAYVQAMPAMIHMNGLGQTAAFYRSKSGGKDSGAKAYDAVYQILSDWLTGKGQVYQTSGNVPCQDLLEGITQETAHKYRLAEAEALAYLEWLKKFAEAFIEDKSNEPASPV